MKHARGYADAARALGALGQGDEPPEPTPEGLLSGFRIPSDGAELVILLDDLRETVEPVTNVPEALFNCTAAAAGAARFSVVVLNNPHGCWVRMVGSGANARLIVPLGNAAAPIVVANANNQVPVSFRRQNMRATITTGDTATNPALEPFAVALRQNRPSPPPFFLPGGQQLAVLMEAANTALDAQLHIRELP